TGDAVAALGALAVRPRDGRRSTDLGRPFRALLAKVVGEDIRRARSVRTMYRRDRQARQLQTGVHRGDLRIVPLGDGAQIDLGQDRAGQLQLVRLDVRQVDDDVHAAD